MLSFPSKNNKKTDSGAGNIFKFGLTVAICNILNV